MRMLSRCGLALLVALALGACESVNLIELNGNFAQLSAQAADAERDLNERRISDADYDTLIEVNRESFAVNGDMAVEAAGEAETPRSKASFLNLAVRSYLRSAALRDRRIPDLAQQGRDLCRGAAFQGVNDLPVTCGYFHIVEVQAVANEATRRVTELSRKARNNRGPGDPPPLSAEEGRDLDAALNLLLDQVDAIERAKAGIDFDNADPKFKAVIPRQKVFFFCNADEALARYPDVVKSGPDWDRDARRQEAEARLDSVEADLGITSRSHACG